MKNNLKLMGIATSATLAITLLAGCPGTDLPTGTGQNLGDPQISGRVTKNNQPVEGRMVFLKKYLGSEGSFANGSKVEGVTTKTDSAGRFTLPVPADAANAGGLFGVGYDATNADPKNISAGTLTDEIQWFTSPAINLANKTGKTVAVNFDVAWNTAAFQPSNGAAVQGPNVTFTLPEKMGATEYEIDVRQGTVAGTGTPAFSEKGTDRTFTWNGAANGNYIYQAKAFLTSGIAGITSNQAAAPWATFTVTGAQ